MEDQGSGLGTFGDRIGVLIAILVDRGIWISGYRGFVDQDSGDWVFGVENWNTRRSVIGDCVIGDREFVDQELEDQELVDQRSGLGVLGDRDVGRSGDWEFGGQGIRGSG